MSALLKKEFRLLLPVWITAMLLTIAPTPLIKVFRYDPDSAIFLTFCGTGLGCLILGLAGFGREFESRTFSLLLVQPRQRRQFWRAKIVALVAALLPVGLALVFFNLQRSATDERLLAAVMCLAMAGAMITGGLWTTLLLRQFFASFWISILLPMVILICARAILVELQVADDPMAVIIVLLLAAYAVAGYFLARWLFRTAQDTQWTGGNVSLSSVATWLRWTPAVASPKTTHPVRALFSKEIRLHESSLLAAGLLLMVQLAALLLSRLVKNPEASVLGTLPQMIWMLWLLMPALVGCTAIAEERKLGTFESQLCLPAPHAWQFGVKVCVALVYGVVLGAVVPIATGPFIRIERIPGPNLLEFAWWWSFACLGITIVCFYASSLARYTLHAFGAAIAIGLLGGVLGGQLGGWSDKNFELFGYQLWRGPLFFIVAPGVMLLFAMRHTWRRLRWVWVGFVTLVSLAFYQGVIQSFFEGLNVAAFGGDLRVVIMLTLALGPTTLLLALASKNFKHTQTEKSLWRRNAATWAGCILVSIIVTALVYNRAWEHGMRFEPPAGTPRLHGKVRPMIAKYSRSGWVFVLLPDGRLSAVREYKTVPTSGQWTSRDDEAWSVIPVQNPRTEFIGGSNWVSIAPSLYNLSGVRSDGSLWSIHWWEVVKQNGETEPAGTGHWVRKGQTMRQTEAIVRRVGSDSDWVMVAAGGAHFLALKRDGSIWGWGSNQSGQLGEIAIQNAETPVRIGNDSDWEFIAAFDSASVAVKSNLSVWKWGGAYPITKRGVGKAYIGGIPQKIANLPARASRVFSSYLADVFICDDGSGWGLGQIEANFLGSGYQFPIVTEPHKMWSDGEWTGMDFKGSTRLAAIQKGGSLWRQGDLQSSMLRRRPAPKRIGLRNDWIAVRIYGDSLLALAKDGTLCKFGSVDRGEFELVAPTRRVTWSVNVLDTAN